MWTIPKGWKVEHRSDALVLSRDRGAGRIVIQEGLRPVGTIDELVAAIELPRFELERASIEHLATCEGERAVVARGHVRELAFELGFVLLDDTYVRMTGHGPGTAEVLRELVVATRAFLGRARRRTFSYAPPPGWTRLRSGSGDDTWLAPGYPALRGSITVPRALPVSAREHMSIVRDLLGLAENVPPPSLRVATSKDLTGSLWTRTVTSDDGLELELVVVALTDGVYDYFARAILPREENGVVYELLDSIESLPAAPVTRPSVPTEAVDFWVQ